MGHQVQLWQIFYASIRGESVARLDVSSPAFVVGIRKPAVEIAEQMHVCCKSAYEDFVAEATKFGALYSELTKQTFRPAKVALTTQTSPAPSPLPAAPILASQAPVKRERPEE
jgi:hypothetical protein